MKPTYRKIEGIIGPHAAIRVRLMEDSIEPEDRIYRLEAGRMDRSGFSPISERYLGILGSEVADFARWWAKEKHRVADQAR